MQKYLIFILFGIILFILLNNNEGFNIGCPGEGDPCDDSIFRERCEEHLACVDGICRSAAGGFSRFATSCSVLFKDKGPPKHTGEIGRFDLWKKWASGRASGWDYRWFLVFNNKIQYYVSNQFRGEIKYNTINSIRIVVEGGYNTLHIITAERTYILWAGESINVIKATGENLDKLLEFTILVIQHSKNLQIIEQTEYKVVIEIPRYWEDRGDLLGGNDSLYFILECVCDKGVDINEGNGLQGRQKWYDFVSARQKLLNDNIIGAYNLRDINLGLNANNICMNINLQPRDTSKKIYMAYIIQSSDYDGFNLPRMEEMYNDEPLEYEDDTGRTISTFGTFYTSFFEYDKKVLICVTVTRNITEDPLQNFQYQMGIHRSIGYTKYKYRADPIDVANRQDHFHELSDNGKGSGYGQLSLKLHAYSSFALDLISNSQGDYKKRLLVSHPIESMANIFYNSGLLEDVDFWTEKYDSIFRQITSPEIVYELPDTSGGVLIHIPPNLFGNTSEYTLTLGKTCIYSSGARSSSGPTFIAKNTSMLSLL